MAVYLNNISCGFIKVIVDRVNSLTTWRIEGGSFLLLNMSEGKVRFEKS